MILAKNIYTSYSHARHGKVDIIMRMIRQLIVFFAVLAIAVGVAVAPQGHTLNEISGGTASGTGYVFPDLTVQTGTTLQGAMTVAGTTTLTGALAGSSGVFTGNLQSAKLGINIAPDASYVLNIGGATKTTGNIELTGGTNALVIGTAAGAQRLRVGGSALIAGALQVGSTLQVAGDITGVPDVPGTDNSAASKKYVDTEISSKESWTRNGLNVYYNLGSVGVGTATPTHNLEAIGTIYVGTADADVYGAMQLVSVGDSDTCDGNINSQYACQSSESRTCVDVYTTGTRKRDITCVVSQAITIDANGVQINGAFHYPIKPLIRYTERADYSGTTANKASICANPDPNIGFGSEYTIANALEIAAYQQDVSPPGYFVKMEDTTNGANAWTAVDIDEDVGVILKINGMSFHNGYTGRIAFIYKGAPLRFTVKGDYPSNTDLATKKNACKNEFGFDYDLASLHDLSQYPMQAVGVSTGIRYFLVSDDALNAQYYVLANDIQNFRTESHALGRVACIRHN